MRAINTGPVRSRGRPLRWGVSGIILTAIIPLLAHAAGEVAINIHGNLISGTCDVMLESEPVVNMGIFLPVDFQDNNGTAAIRTIQLRVDNCNKVELSKHRAIQVTGDGHLSGMNTIFNSNPNGDSGFMLRENKQDGAERWLGPLSTFFNPDEAVADGGESFINDDMGDPTAQNGGVVLRYGVGFVATSTGSLPTPSAEPVKANLTFKFIYQ